MDFDYYDEDINIEPDDVFDMENCNSVNLPNVDLPNLLIDMFFILLDFIVIIFT